MNKIIDWNNVYVEYTWRKWPSSLETKIFPALPLIIIRGIWIARNNDVFHEKLMIHELNSLCGLDILSHFPWMKNSIAVRIIQEEAMDKNIP